MVHGCAAPPIWIPRPRRGWLSFGLPVVLLAVLAVFLRLQPPCPEPIVVVLFSSGDARAGPGKQLLHSPGWISPLAHSISRSGTRFSDGLRRALVQLSSTRRSPAPHRPDVSARPTPKLIGGFLPIKEVGDLMWGEDRIIGLTYESAGGGELRSRSGLEALDREVQSGRLPVGWVSLSASPWRLPFSVSIIRMPSVEST